MKFSYEKAKAILLEKRVCLKDIRLTSNSTFLLGINAHSWTVFVFVKEGERTWLPGFILGKELLILIGFIIYHNYSSSKIHSILILGY